MKINSYIKPACLFAATICMSMMVSCTSDDVAGSSSDTPPEGASDQKISLNVVSPEAAVTTRGTGTVGSTDASTNKWAGQTVKVFMFNSGTLDVTSFQYDANNNPLDTIFYNTEMYTPGKGIETTEATKGLASCVDGAVKYYPLKGSSDFWGYRLDDAAPDTAYEEDNKIVIPFTLDGSQDVLTGKADKATDISAASAQIDASDAYSAKSSRLNVVPNIVFQHELTRLQFFAKASNHTASDKADSISISDLKDQKMNPIDQARYDKLSPEEQTNFKLSTGVYIDTIRILSAYTGKLVAAYNATKLPNGSQGILWNEKKDASGKLVADSTFFNLMERSSATASAAEDLVPLSPTLPADTTATVGNQVGEALFVSPKADRTYRIEISMHQYVKGRDDWWVSQESGRTSEYGSEPILYPARPYVQPIYITLPKKDAQGNEIKDLKGYSFNVNMTIWGLDQISVSAQLTPWKYGGQTGFTIM